MTNKLLSRYEIKTVSSVNLVHGLSTDPEASAISEFHCQKNALHNNKATILIPIIINRSNINII